MRLPEPSLRRQQASFASLEEEVLSAAPLLLPHERTCISASYGHPDKHCQRPVLRQAKHQPITAMKLRLCEAARVKRGCILLVVPSFLSHSAYANLLCMCPIGLDVGGLPDAPLTDSER